MRKYNLVHVPALQWVGGGGLLTPGLLRYLLNFLPSLFEIGSLVRENFQSKM